MRSSIRRRLGRTAASVTTAVAVAALSATLGASAAHAESTNDPAAPSPAESSISAEITAENGTLDLEASAPGADVSAEADVTPQDEHPTDDPDGGPTLGGNVTILDDGDNDGASYKAQLTVVVGEQDANNVSVNLTATNASLIVQGDSFSCAGGADGTQCNAGSLAPGEYILTLTGTVNDPIPGKLVAISATIAADDAEQQLAEGTYTVPADYGSVLQGKVWYDNGDGIYDAAVDKPAGSEVTVKVIADGREIPGTVSGGDYSVSGVIGKNVTVLFGFDDEKFIPAPIGQGGGTTSDANANGVVNLGTVGANDDLLGRADLGLKDNGGGGGDPTDPEPTDPDPTDPDPTDPAPTDPNPTNTGDPTNTGGPTETDGPSTSSGGNTTKTPPPGKLPKTGAAIGGTLAAGAVMVAGGAAVSLAARKREEEAAEDLA